MNFVLFEGITLKLVSSWDGYFVYESKAPDEYIKDDRYFYFKITEAGQTVVIENEKGVGIGLYLTANILNTEGGRVSAKSDGNGSTFTVYLPKI